MLLFTICNPLGEFRYLSSHQQTQKMYLSSSLKPKSQRSRGDQDLGPTSIWEPLRSLHWEKLDLCAGNLTPISSVMYLIVTTWGFCGEILNIALYQPRVTSSPIVSVYWSRYTRYDKAISLHKGQDFLSWSRETGPSFPVSHSLRSGCSITSLPSWRMRGLHSSHRWFLLYLDVSIEEFISNVVYY